MAKLSLYEVNQAQLEQIPKIDGQLIVISDTGSIYRDIVVNGVVNRILIGNDIIAVDELPLAPISNKIYYLKPNKLYTYNSGWVDLTSGSDVVQIQSDYFQNDPAELDYIKNRPFYDTRVRSYYSQAENPNPVSFDNAMLNLTFYKVSDLIPTRDEIFNNTKVIVDGQEYTPNETEIVIETDDFVFMGIGGKYDIGFVNKFGKLNFTYGGYPMSITVPEGEAGIYYSRAIGSGIPEGRVIEIISGGELKTLDQKYLPEGMAYGYESKPFEDIVWDGNTEGLLSTNAEVNMGSDGVVTFYAYKVSDKVLSKTDIIGAEVTLIDGDGSENTNSNISSDELIDVNPNGSFMDSTPGFFGITEDNTTADLSVMLEGLTVYFPEAGIWFLKPEMSGTVMFCAKSLIAKTNISKIEGKYIATGEANGVAGLDSNGKIPQNQINTVNGVSQYNYNPITSDAVYTALDNRDRLRFDTTPMSGSQNPVTSDGVYWAIENKNVTVDSSVQSGSNNPVSGNAIFQALGSRTKLEFDNVPTSGSGKLMMSGDIYTAIENKKITVDSTVQSSSNNAVSGKAVYNTLSNYYTKTEVDNLLGDIDTVLDEINALIGE